ncbi:hypothetical protein FRC06_007317 [Ceratobasidium sp. 370]|nr:hypothetical protein FRC06_007317 [Ceratobasidium sp. 370]
MHVSVAHSDPTAVSSTPARGATPDLKRAPAPTYGSRPAPTHNLAPRPIADPERAISHATSGPVRVSVRAPTRNLSPNTFIAPTPSPAPASPSVPESTSNLAHYPTTPSTSAYAASPVPVRASVHHPTAPQTPQPDPAASPTPPLRPVSLLVPSPSQPGKYLYVSRRSVPVASGSTFAPQVVHDSVLAFTADPSPGPSPTSPTSRCVPPPAPIRAFPSDSCLIPVATSTPVRGYDSSPASASVRPPAPVSASASAFDDSSVQSGSDAMSALDSAIWAIDSAIFALDMVSILELDAEAAQDQVPIQNQNSVPAQDPLPAQNPISA